MEVSIGTSGYVYADWKEVFYPRGTKDFLSYYQQFFKIVEINSTYYQEIDASFFKNIARKTRNDFSFAVKAYSTLTHKRDDFKRAAKKFKEALLPLSETDKLVSVLMQFPFSFRNEEKNVSYINRVHDELQGLPINIEFRNISWENEDVFNWLKGKNLGYCCVDVPDIENLPTRRSIVTSDIAYIRFHSRNAEKWYLGAKERYDYLYSEEELNEWVPGIENMKRNSRKTIIFFNNCHAGQAVRNAQMLQSILGEEVFIGEFI
ncbi:MAG: DUF72 domain-containing protein [Candidatus Coatesbacteria bacterium]|nr:DUF72 domain-containing protein [Candidatus Coatesbacteria bacterium]